APPSDPIRRPRCHPSRGGTVCIEPDRDLPAISQGCPRAVADRTIEVPRTVEGGLPSVGSFRGQRFVCVTRRKASHPAAEAASSALPRSPQNAFASTTWIGTP